MLVFRRPCALRRVHRRIEMIYDARWRVSRFERGGVYERFERRARLAPSLHGTVEAAIGEGATADHRAHFAARWINRHERRLQWLLVTGGVLRPGFGGAPRFDLLERLRDVS